MRILTPFLLLVLAAAAPAQEAVAPSGQELLHGVHEMRVRLENDRAVSEQRAQQSTLAVVRSARGVPGISEMRRDLQESLDRVEINHQCLDVDVEGNQGNLILICGDNAGLAENTTTTSSSPTHIILPPAPGPASEPTP